MRASVPASQRDNRTSKYLAYSGAALPTMLLRPAKLLGALSRQCTDDQHASHSGCF